MTYIKYITYSKTSFNKHIFKLFNNYYLLMNKNIDPSLQEWDETMLISC